MEATESRDALQDIDFKFIFLLLTSACRFWNHPVSAGYAGFFQILRAELLGRSSLSSRVSEATIAIAGPVAAAPLDRHQGVVAIFVQKLEIPFPAVRIASMPERTESDLPLDLGTRRTDAEPHGRLRRRYLLVFLVPALMFTGAVIGMYFQPPPLRGFYAVTGLQPGGGSASPIALPPNVELPAHMAETMLPSDVVGLARLMPNGDVSVVAAPYGAGDARIAEILVTVGQHVEKGAALARLDNAASLQSAVLSAEANLAIREATLMQTRATVLASRDDAQAALDQAFGSASEATASLHRSEQLFRRGVTTQETLDSVRTSSQTAVLAVTRAKATLARFASIDLDEQPDVIVAARNVEAGRAELARARLDLQRAEVVAPIAGTILDINATPGQRPPADGIMQMGDISQMMAEVEIWQDRIGKVAVGQPVEMGSSVLEQTLRGRIDAIGLTVGRQGMISDDAAENKDARVIRILVALDAASSATASRFTNLEVIARIDTAASKAAP